MSPEPPQNLGLTMRGATRVTGPWSIETPPRCTSADVESHGCPPPDAILMRPPVRAAAVAVAARGAGCEMPAPPTRSGAPVRRVTIAVAIWVACCRSEEAPVRAFPILNEFLIRTGVT